LERSEAKTRIAPTLDPVEGEAGFTFLGSRFASIGRASTTRRGDAALKRLSSQATRRSHATGRRSQS
jgi:hypothetical protein